MEEGKLYRMQSGAMLFVSVSPYDRAMALHDALGAELRGNGLGSLDIGKIQKTVESGRKARVAAAAGIAFEPDEDADGGLNVIVVVNQNSTNSVQLGNDYCELRGVPPQNVFRMTGWTGDRTNWTQGDFQTLLLKKLLCVTK